MGVANELRRAAIPYCVALSQPTPREALYADTIMQYSGAFPCSAPAAVEVRTYCESGTLFIDAGDGKVDLGPC